ncbi:universal stress protein [Variovorax sp. 375MFSha3.1]|uniref:Universal stress protein n=1 Tax=Variovorax guangxiensis TaxID=1775474 RepID=A0A433MEZ4_9BURK|nr:universal stress protein [Variovorax guangxiensis]RUR66325.1 universal stress protein [Variovorax guangxiensis]
MYRRILVPIDGSPASAQGIEEAIRLARPMRSRVRLLHAIDDLSVSRAGYAHDRSQQLREEASRMLARSAERVRSAGVEVDTVLYNETDGTVASLVADEARGWHADLIIAGTRGRRGLGQLLLGSSTERIVRGSSVPVLLVHAAVGEQATAG